ncbi:hypothetical protein ANN_07382 [Periplaneta americana]|uniref:LNR domain-containing protein n=1 Tax=Periplaneta americana TaxID=6978 RepID=A0ABQ8T031_PERAM|nr:hypothetical protein ANN_07382 [Periplaneta americana]
MTLWKIIQRHTYDLLSHKYSVIIILISFSTILVSVIQFGEVWMTWSQEKYEAVFNSFSDNIVGKSLQSKLCQTVPIDVVYTWVNGSDPVLLQQLEQYRLQLQEETSKKCSHANCVPSHIATFRQWLSDESVAEVLQLIGAVNASQRLRVKVSSSNWTLVEFQSPSQVVEAVRLTFRSNISLNHAHWTTDSSVPSTYADSSTVIVSGLSDAVLRKTGSVLHAELTRQLQTEIQNFWVYSEKRLMVVKMDSGEAFRRSSQLPSNVTIGGQLVNVSKAYLIMELPLLGNSKDFSPSRFEDKEELRYSLRSLERFAPWVRHVYLVTNGQIPYWLDLENPRLTIITHDMIFPDPSHLPTFSSPAIESHLHRISGLSRKFLYLNDDVMFGKEVWPDDFITNANGQKVYLSWPVPDCSDSCPWSWVADGSCDVSCNTSECSFDGGDCDLSEEDDLGIYDENRHLANYEDDLNSYNENQHHHAHDTVNDNLFRNMNFGGDIVLEDVPDSGKRMNSLLDILIRKNVKDDNYKGNLTYFKDIEDVKYMNAADVRETDPEYTTPYVSPKNISKKISDKLGTKKNSSWTDFKRRGKNYTLSHRDRQKSNVTYHNASSGNSLVVSESTVMLQQQPTVYNNSRVHNINQSEYSTQSFVQKLFGVVNNEDNLNYWNDKEGHDEFYPQLSKHDENQMKTEELKNNINRIFYSKRNKKVEQNSTTDIAILHNSWSNTGTFRKKQNESLNVNTGLKTDQISVTEKAIGSSSGKHKVVRDVSYNAKLYKLYQKLNGKHNAASVPQRQQLSEYDTDWDVVGGRGEDKLSKATNGINTKKKQKAVRVYDAQQYGIASSSGKKPRDTFAESLLYVNRLYNQEFGFEPRKVPAHMPHLIDIDVMERLQTRFSQQWQLTSSHRVRNANDMQFAFSYFYFLMSCKDTLPLVDIFDIFDTDRSGTWSDREIRTLLTRSYELPLSYARVVKFENDIMNCSRDLPQELTNILIPTPPYERYQDSKLPVVSKALISNCKPVADMLLKKFGSRKVYRYQVERDKHQDVSFKMLNSNISQLVSHLDDIRRDPKKFICLNDNLDPEREEDNAVARAILQDMYESLFPQPSSFELPPEFRNRFLHMKELQAWRASRNTVRTIVYICLAILIGFTLVNFFHMECRWLQRKFFQRTRQQCHEDTQPLPCV